MASCLDVRVVGDLTVHRDGAAVAIGGPKPRELLAMLVAARGSTVSADRLIEVLWGDGLPNDPGAVLQGNISRLRRVLEPEARIVARPTGYALEVPDDCIDAWRFEAACRRASELLPTDPPRAAAQFEQALATCVGTPFAEFVDHEWTRADVAMLRERHTAATEEWMALRLEIGDDAALIAELEAMVVVHPLRERPWLLLATALFGAGRSAEALRRLGALRSMLRDELGLDPSAAARALELQILDGDSTLHSVSGGHGRRRSPAPSGDPSALVGRSADVAAVVGHVSAQRIVTLVGPGGVGKTRIAQRVAGDVWQQPGGEVYVCELAVVHDPQAIVAAVASAVGVQQRQHLSVEQSLAEFLRGRRALLVLDNCEHLRASVARLIEGLLAACPELAVLTTSREVLGLPAEFVWRVEPLGVAALVGSTEETARAPAVRLFVERAMVASPSFVMTAQNVDAVAEIVRRVDGLPLAIELAAARVRAMTPTAIAERLERRFDLLDDAQKARVERHRTVHELVAWSYNLLSVEEQLVFARLSVFAGSFGLDAAEAVCDDAPQAGPDSSPTPLTGLLAALVDKSMVQMTDASRGRYRMLATLRDFARSQVGEDEWDYRCERHASWYLVGCETAAAEFAGPGEAAAMTAIEHDLDNIRAAFAWSSARGDLVGCARFVVALREFSFRAMRSEVISWADVVIAMPGFADEPRSPLVMAVAAYGRFVRGDLDGSIALGSQALAAAERLGAGSSGLAERALGNSHFYLGNEPEAQHWIDRMLADARGGSPARLAHALYMRSVAFTSVGEVQRGVEVAEEAVDAARRSGSPTAMAEALYALGLALESSDEVVAAAMLDQAIDAAAGAGNSWIRAFALTEVLWLEARRGEPLAALGKFVEVIELWFRGGDWANQWLSLRHVFDIFVQVGDHRSAATLHGALSAVGAAFALPFGAAHSGRQVQLIETVRAALTGAEFAAAVRRGAAMSDGEVIEFVTSRIESAT